MVSERKSKLKKKEEKHSEKKPGQEFAFHFKYKNDLPKVPFDPFLLAYPHGVDRLYKYFDSTILKKQKFDYIHPDGEQGLGCNPFFLGFFERSARTPDEKLVPRKDLLDPKDLALLAQPVEKKADTKDVPNVPWLHRTEYISTERSAFGRKKTGIEVGMSVKKETEIQKILDLTPAEQIERIEESFEQAKSARLSTLKHPKNSSLKALEIFPIFPDFDTWANPYFVASYDKDPLGDKITYQGDDHDAALQETILKPLKDPDNPEESWLAFYAPTVDALEKIKIKRKLEELGRDVPEEEYEHDFVRDFDPQVSALEKLKFPFFMEMRKDEGGAFYHPIETQMKLRKRRAISKQNAGFVEEVDKPMRVILKNRPLGDDEKAERKEKMQQLLQRTLDDDE